MTIDAGRVMEVYGVRSRKGGTSQNQFEVTSFSVQCSEEDASINFIDVKSVQDNLVFTGTSGNFDAIFKEPVKARHIRITVEAYLGYPSMRAGLLISVPPSEADTSLFRARTSAVAHKQEKQLAFKAATMAKVSKDDAATSLKVIAAAAAAAAAGFDKLEARMSYVGAFRLSIIHPGPIHKLGLTNSG